MGPLYILAGGMATRLGDLSKQTPKYLMEVEKGKVFADLHLEWAAEQGFEEVILCVGNLADQIQDHCKDGKAYGLKLSYAHDGKIRMGTGGALKQAWLPRKDKRFAVTYGDTYLTLNSSKLFEMLEASNKAKALMTVLENKVEGHTANVVIDEQWAVYNKQTPDKSATHIDYGFLLFKDSFMNTLPDGAFDLAESLQTCAQSRELLAWQATTRFWEIGSPEALSDFQSRNT